jgi:hypothetical protein
MDSAGVRQVLAALLLKLGELQVQEHRCAAADQDYQAMHQDIQKNVYA